MLSKKSSTSSGSIVELGAGSTESSISSSSSFSSIPILSNSAFLLFLNSHASLIPSSFDPRVSAFHPILSLSLCFAPPALTLTSPDRGQNRGFHMSRNFFPNRTSILFSTR
ncbi:hypothetical protein E6O75_ATG09936 [Venturia nashicola]|uniref:Uncharacterized protein n=1 Tax=Venturia nashicola TaxID=86259 RepID=A0A4Z1P939_9PEZI|nr:hypothetical protein E6O75_ATG09936 [Venturia nashicola]